MSRFMPRVSVAPHPVFPAYVQESDASGNMILVMCDSAKDHAPIPESLRMGAWVPAKSHKLGDTGTVQYHFTGSMGYYHFTPDSKPV